MMHRLLASLIGLAVLLATLQIAYAHTNSAWSPPINLSQTEGSSSGSEILVAPNGEYYVLYSDDSEPPYEARLYYRLLQPDGTWTPAQRTPFDSSSYTINFDAIIDRKGTLHVLANGVYASRNTGGDWSEPVVPRVSGRAYPAMQGESQEVPSEPLMLRDPGPLFVAPNGQLFIASTDGRMLVKGEASLWEQVQSPGNYYNCRYGVTADAAVHMICDSDNQIVYHKYVQNTEWSKSFLLSSGLYPTYSGQAELGSDGRFHVIWKERTGYQTYTYFYRYLTNGQWSNPVTLDFAPGDADVRLVHGDSSGGLHLQWGWDGKAHYGVLGTNHVWSEEVLPEAINDQGGLLPRMWTFTSSEDDVHVIWCKQSCTYGTSTPIEHLWRSAADAHWYGPTGLDATTYNFDLSVATGAKGALHITWWSGGEILYSAFDPAKLDPYPHMLYLSAIQKQ